MMARRTLTQAQWTQWVTASKSHPHGRSAARLAELAQCHDADIVIECAHYRINAKSILDILSLCRSTATGVTLVAEGWDAAQAVRILGDYFDTACLPPAGQSGPVASE
jgi:phosphotransferase system HPr (HPr) family protein